VDSSGDPAIGMAVDKILQFTHLPFGSTKEHVSEPASTGQGRGPAVLGGDCAPC
jgi:hypothetical protein